VKRYPIAACALVAALTLTSAANGQEAAKTPPGVTPAAQNGVAVPDYRIGPEDILQVSVWKNEALSRTLTVRPDGKISLPLLGDVVATGHTTSELKDVLATQFAEYMPLPEVSVIVVEVRSAKVSVLGEVPKPGRYDLRSDTTVLDVLALAGGLNQFASRSRIVVLRPDSGKMKRIPFNYNKVVSAGGEAENFYLKPGDIVLVP
jgi:polysaccharide export outer membrane protein